jgi:PIN domain nuclease of toxin-antitoxin system
MEAGETGHFSAAGARRIESAARRGALWISAISVWEAAMLDAKGRIALEPDALAWIRKSLEISGMTLAPLTVEIAVLSTRLPGPPAGDPADRILLATARAEGLTLITRDRKLLDYAKHHRMDVVSA